MTPMTWAIMPEKARDVGRDLLRSKVGLLRQGMHELSGCDRLMVSTLDALLMADRIELGLALLIAWAAEEKGQSDVILTAIKAGIDRAESKPQDPSLN